MTWKEKTVVAILLLVARMLASDVWAAEIKSLATHIAVNAKVVAAASSGLVEGQEGT